MPKRVLFLCTGNYYRSRFAEILFNHLAARSGLAWRADSRGLARVFGAWNVGPISPYTLAAMKTREIQCDSTQRNAILCDEDDLKSADLVVALKEAEHRPMLREHFPAWEKCVEYWHVHDLDQAEADAAMSEIEQLVRRLVERLKDQ